MCKCKVTASGIVVCDTCASAIIERLNDLLPTEQVSFDQVFTPGEYKGLVGLVDGWLDSLQQPEEAQA